MCASRVDPKTINFKYICHFCKQKGTWQACNGCKVVYYCTPQHQSLDAKHHNKVCTTYQKVAHMRSFLYCFEIGGEHKYGSVNVCYLPNTHATKLIKKNARSPFLTISLMPGIKKLKFRDQEEIIFFIEHRDCCAGHRSGIKGYEEKIKALIAKQKYKETLPYLWGEKNQDYLEQFLIEIIDKAYHPLLMLEYSVLLDDIGKTAKAYAYSKAALALLYPLYKLEFGKNIIQKLAKCYALFPPSRDCIKQELDDRIQETEKLFSLILKNLDKIVSLEWLSHSFIPILSGELPPKENFSPSQQEYRMYFGKLQNLLNPANATTPADIFRDEGLQKHAHDIQKLWRLVRSIGSY